MVKIKNAIILAAGLGSRLHPLTLEVPKCLTEVNGKSLIENTIEILEKNGITETVIVIGYLGDIVKKKIGNKYRNMKISFIWNKNYQKTNSMYSVWLARSYLKKGTILIEGDTIFEESLISKVLQTPGDQTYWVGDLFTRKYRGSMSVVDKNNRITDLRIIREEFRNYSPNFFKSTGVIKITPGYGKLFSKWLDEEVKEDNIQIYYDLVIAKHLQDEPIYIYNFSGGRWNEIDNLDDLKEAEKNFTSMKYMIIILDGAADYPLSDYAYRTPFEIAYIPNIDSITKAGKTGLMRTMYPGLPVGSIVANLGILGYNPMRYYPDGRASFEALAHDIFLDENDIAFRCNLIKIDEGKLVDFTANNISDSSAKNLINNFEISQEDINIYHGQSYRNLLIAKNVKCNASDFITSEPHTNIGKNIDDLLIKGTSPNSNKIAENLNQVMLISLSKFKDFNREIKNSTADMIFLWGPSSEPRLPSFHKKFGIDAAIISGIDFMHGIGIAGRMETRRVPGATGYSDTNLSEKLRYAKDSLRHNNLVYLHINAPDEESHRKKINNKIKIIEKIDNEVIGPLKKHLDKKYYNHYRLAILPDHYTLLSTGHHHVEPVPYVIYGKGIKPDSVESFSEKTIGKNSKSIIKSYEFMDFLIS